jgi:hypothetical protein
MTEIAYEPGLLSPPSDRACTRIRGKSVSWHRGRDTEEITLLKEAMIAYLRECSTTAVFSAEAGVSLEERFREHAAKWERETRHVSSMTDIVMHSSYQAIIKMGPDVISILLRDMKENGRIWFTALAQLACENPIKPSDAGRVDRMTTSWLKWGKQKGLL